MSRFAFALPVACFAALALFLARGLSLDSQTIPSALVGLPAPAFALPRLDDEATRVSPADLRGRPWLLNVWASWCVSCRFEHPHLLALARDEKAFLVGLNYKDDGADARAWLAQNGDPYQFSLTDRDGRAGIEWGVYGVPETFVIDSEGNVAMKHVGPLAARDIEETILPLLAKLAAARQ